MVSSLDELDDLLDRHRPDQPLPGGRARRARAAAPARRDRSRCPRAGWPTGTTRARRPAPSAGGWRMTEGPFLYDDDPMPLHTGTPRNRNGTLIALLSATVLSRC